MTHIQTEADAGLADIYSQIQAVHQSTQPGESGCQEWATPAVLEGRPSALLERQLCGSLDSQVALEPAADELHRILTERGCAPRDR